VGGEALAANIPPRYQQIAYQHQIPGAILYAVALAESGMVLKSGKFRAWPWTLNVAGKPKRYKTRKEAWKAIRYFMKQGIRSIDIGLLQVNWHWNGNKLGNTWTALDPVFNAKTGAKILQQAFAIKRNWPEAIGHYHSPGKKPGQKYRANKYSKRVMKHYKRITTGDFYDEKNKTLIAHK
jgi:hypothetical protein